LGNDVYKIVFFGGGFSNKDAIFYNFVNGTCYEKVCFSFALPLFFVVADVENYFFAFFSWGMIPS
jgi:hypothetical protein